MRAAAALAIYAVVVAWCGPVPLVRLTARGISARLGLVAWLAAMASALVSAALALFFLIRTVRADWPSLTLAVCREVAGNACTPVIYRSALYELGLAALVVVGSMTALVSAWRYGRKVQRAHRRTAEHGRAVRIVGRELPGTGALVLEDSRPAAYCVAGTIVVTRGALTVLDEAQLATVLAHERAHLRGRHHVIALTVRGLTAAFPGVPLFGRGLAEVARLSEMSADDAAVRVAGERWGRRRGGGPSAGGRRAVLAAALVAIATGEAVPGSGLVPGSVPVPGSPVPGSGPVPGSALAAAAYAVQARVERMLRPVSTARRAAVCLLLATAAGVVVSVPAVLAVLGG